MKNVKLKRSYVILMLLVLSSFLFVHIAQAVTADPGSDGDPIVTQSYVDQKLAELTTKYETKITELTGKIDASTVTVTELTKKIETLTAANDALGKQIKEVSPDTMKFKPIQVKAGQQLLAGESAEIIIRSGKAKAVSGTNGGLSDITAGTGADIKNASIVPLNHLLLVSRDDGRGFTAVNDVWIIIKGTYTIK